MSHVVRKTGVACCAAAAALILPSVGRVPGRSAALSGDLLVVQIPAAAAPQSGERSRATPLDRYVDGARIVRVDAVTLDAVVLTPEFAGAADPDVSVDGETIVFAGKRGADDAWQIWTMRPDGSGKAQVTQGSGLHVAPAFAGARFYLDDPQPTPQIIFAGRTADTGAVALYGTDVTGAVVRRLTFNLHSDFAPAVLPTGQIVFSSRQRYGDRSDPEGLVALLTVSIDGTDLMPFYGNHEMPRDKDMAAVSPVGDRVYFVESDRPPWLGGGDLASVSWRRPLHSYGRLGGEAAGAGVFHSPAPLPDGQLLASYRPLAADAVFAVYRLDAESGRRVTKVFEQAGWHSIDVHALAPRAPFRGRSNWLQPGATTGVFYCLDAYRTSPGPDGSRTVAPRGTIKHVRVIEGTPRRILGVAPVADDGSFYVRVPAETPVTFQLLDEDYVALRTQRAWTWVMGNENRGCIGCHEDPELSPPNRVVAAIVQPPVDLTLPPERRRTVDFRHQVAPIVAARCATAGCHVRGGVTPTLGEAAPAPAPAASDLRAVYDTLLEGPAGGAGRPYVVPDRAGESPLIRRLLGREAGGTTGAAPHRAMLGQPELIRLIEWVDLGAAWDRRSDREGSSP